MEWKVNEAVEGDEEQTEEQDGKVNVRERGGEGAGFQSGFVLLFGLWSVGLVRREVVCRAKAASSGHNRITRTMFH